MSDRPIGWRPPASNPYEDVFAERDRTAAGGALITAPPNADAAARANVLARQSGLPADTVLRDLAKFEQDARRTGAIRDVQGSDYMSSWFADPARAAAAQDDTATLRDISDQFQAFWGKGAAQRRAEIAAPAQAFFARARQLDPETAQQLAGMQAPTGFFGKLGDFLNKGIFGFEAGLDRLEGAASATLGLTDHAKFAARQAQQKEALAGARIDGEISFANLKSKPTIGNIVSYGGQQTVQAVPSVGAAIVAFPLMVASMLGQTGQDRAVNNGRDAATTSDIITGSPFALTAAFLDRFGLGKAWGAVGRNIVTRTAKGLAVEAATQAGQSGIQYAGGTVGTDAGFDPGEAFNQVIAGGLTGVFLGGAIRGAHEGIARLRGDAHLLADANQAAVGAQVLDTFMQRAAASKLRERDPEAFRQFIDGQAQGTAAENVYIPAEAIRALNQNYHEDPFFRDYREQIDQALALDGDVVLPTGDVAARLAGTPEWETLKQDARFSPGGMSPAELEHLQATHGEALADVGARVAGEVTRALREAGPASAVHAEVRDALSQAGFAPEAAERYAQLYAANREAWAQRLGTEALSYHRANPIAFRRVLPESLARVQAAGDTDLVINAMKRGSAAAKAGPSLVEWIAKQGGIEDRGGDLASMGAGDWHKGRPGRRKLIRPHEDGQGDMLGGTRQQNANSPDEMAVRAQEAGYFPPGERPTVNDLLEAIHGELRGHPVHADSAVPTGRDADIRAAAEDLRRVLEDRGVDPDKATRPEVLAAIAAHQAEQEMAGRRLGQGAPEQWRSAVDAVLRGEPKGRQLEVGKVSAALRSVGLGEGSVVMSASKLATAWKKHQVPADVLHNLPALIEEPLAVFPSAKRDGTQIVATVARDRNGDPVIVPLVAHESGGAVVLSVYGKSGSERASGDEWIAKEIAQAQADGLKVFLGKGFADLKPQPAEQSSAPPSDLIPAGGSAKPGRKILSLGTAVKRQLDQQEGDNARGRISFTDGGAVIELFQHADLSTLLHETGHGWLEELKRNAESADAPADVRADWDAVKGWFAEQGHGVGEDGFVPTEAHELFARGFERYAMEGKAPSSALRAAFDAFRSWLLRIYRHVDALSAPITPAVREVFDRMLASEDAIDAEARREDARGLFDEAARAGMTDAEFAAYRGTVTAARSEAKDALLAKTMDVIRRRRTQEWKKQEGAVRDQVAGQVNARPEFTALHLLQTGSWLDAPERQGVKVKLSREWIVQNFGEDALALLPRTVPPIHAEKGIDGDTLAEMTGASSGDTLVRTLMGIEASRREMRAAGDERTVRQRTIDDETETVMRKRHGDPLTDGSIEQEAIAAVNNARRGEVLATEARILGRRVGEAATPAELVRQFAERTIAEGTVADVASRAAMQRYRRNMDLASRLAEEAYIKGDADAAFRHKQAQLFNHALLSEAIKAADEVDKIVERLSRIANKATMKTIDQDYLDRAHGMLEAFDFRPRSQKSIDTQEVYADWANQQRANGIDVMPLPRMTSQGVHYSRISVEELRGLDASVEQVMHLGRFKQKLIDQKEERDLDAVVQEAVGNAERLHQRPPSNLMDPSLGDRFKSGVAAADASLLKMEEIFDWLDHGDANGVFNRIVFRPIADAQDRENTMLRDYYERVRKAMETVPKETIRQWAKRVDTPELLNRETGEPYVLTRQNLVAMALNVGNEGNLQRLADGYGWSENSIMRVLNRELSAEEWHFVQKTWDIIETLWPQIAAMERRINGVAPDKVRARGFDTSAGSLRGGYYPAVYDTSRSLEAEHHAGKANDLFETMYTRATTRASATKDRLEKVRRPILLQLGVINRHLGEVIHDITHREAIINADKFLSSKRVQAAVDRSLGPEIRKQFRPWLKFVANQWAIEKAGNEGLGKWMNKARSNATIVGMGFRISTIMAQIAGYSNSVEYVGGKWVAAAIARTGASPVETFNFALSRSGELRDRMDTLDRDIRTGIAQLAGKTSALSAAKRFAFHGIGYMDRVVAVPTWLGAYNKAIAGGATEGEAIYAGDKAIRLSQGSGSPKDLAAIQRGTGKWGQALKLMTMFYSYMSVVYQRNRSLGRDVMQAGRERDLRATPHLLARAWWLVAVPPVLSAILAGQGPQDGEDWGAWALKKMMSQLLGPIPGVRDVVEPTWDAIAGNKTFGYQLSPLQRAGDSIVTTGKDLGHIARGEPTQHATKDTLETVGYTTGLVPGQAASAAQFFVDLGNGEQHPETVADWYRGVTTGHAEKKK
ncbi:acetyltransferase [Sphingomonas sp. AR_OL41]|uniref:MuF-C-terminal domain-containing protein n=1 Tax=Sphingomonas sp. AR_OL41 TaxID=3042729 RepID=UPI002480A3EF|nr:acetyltransferase [Sphingomonas sp. AR_OL41]MDH7973681.1 acetyltransferase [Sphingomonas sp. AR_OL41]